MSYIPTPTPALGYVRGLRRSPERWRAVVAILAALVMLVGALAVVVPLGALIDTMAGADTVGLDDFRLTPGTWLAGAVGLAALIPLSGLAQRWIYGVPARWLVSTEGRFRGRWAAKSTPVTVPVFLVVTVILSAVAPRPEWQAAHLPLALAALAVTPLQAAGEEWLFRGLIGRALAAPFARRSVSLGVSLAGSTALFWLGHGALEPVSVLYYLAAGTGFWLTAEWTGGLEAGAVMHACANTFLVVPAVMSGGLGATTGLHGWILLAPALVWLAMPFALRAMARTSTPLAPARRR